MASLLSNLSNPILNSTIIASSVREAVNTVRPKITTRQGLGVVQITGGYTGFNDAGLDIEIVNTAGTTMRTSEPVLIGSGTGTLTDVSADTGSSVETIDLTLSNLGTVTKPATLDFFGVTLKSRLPGVAGNAIQLSVDTTSIVRSPTPWSTIEDIAKDTLDLQGPQYTFGSLPLMGDGTLNPNTVRFSFGDDPVVYREYSVFENGQTLFKLDRALVADVKSGTPLKVVTGDYVVTVTDGSDTEIYNNIVTLYDFLSAVKATSNLIEVDGVVIDDQTPGGMAVDEFPLRTGAYALATSCSSEVGSRLSSVTVTADCPGQLVEIKCKDNTVVGAEKWNVIAPSEGGMMGEAISGEPFTSAHFGFAIPRVIPENSSSVGMTLNIQDISYAERGEGEPEVKICVDIPTCGINATAKTITCVYTKKPSEDCKCEDASYEGTLSEDCLGIKVESGVTNTVDSNLSTMLVALYSWRNSWMRANTSVNDTNVRSAYYDQNLCDSVTDSFSKCALEIYLSEAARTEWTTRFNEMVTDLSGLATSTISTMDDVPEWQPSTTYHDGDWVTPPATMFNGHQYLIVGCSIQTGASGYTFGTSTSTATGPSSWPTNFGSISDQWYDQVGQTTYRMNFRDMGSLTTGDITGESSMDAVRSDFKDFVRRYDAAMDYCRVLAGIVPKGKASGTGGDCWQPRDDAYYWTVTDGSQQYLPAYTDVVYHACTGKMDGSVVNCTKELSFVIKVNSACTGNLKEGDTVTLEITGENTGNKSYQVGDLYHLPIIAGAPVHLAGGIEGNDTLTWSVRGSVSGALTPLSFTGAQSSDYNLHHLHFKIVKGAVPFALNDQLSFGVEGGQFRYRFNGGAWSLPVDIPTASTAIGQGLEATFISGSGESFVTGDQFSYEIIQPYSPVNLLKPGYRFYEFTGSTCTLTMDFGTSTPVYGFALGTHQLPATSTLVLQGLDEGSNVLWSKNLTWSSGVISTLFNLEVAHQLKLTVSDATEGKIGWIWTGNPLQFRNSPSDVTLNRTWKSAKSRYLGSGSGCELTWDGNTSFLYQTEIDDLIDTLDYSKSNHDQPLILIVNDAFPADSRLVRFDSDSIELSEWYRFQVMDDSNEEYRIIGTRTLPFKGVIT